MPQRLSLTLLTPIALLLSIHPSPQCAAQSKNRVPIELKLVDAKAIGYATFQSHNQKVVANEHGIFFTYVQKADSRFKSQLWRLVRTKDGKSFDTIFKETRATSAPALESNRRGRLFVGRPDFTNGHAYLSEFGPPFTKAHKTTILSGGSAGKYCMLLNEAQNQIVFFANNGQFFVVAANGKAKATRLLVNGKKAVLMYPHLTMGRDGTIYAAWTTQQHGKYCYRSIHALKSTDGGLHWESLDGGPVKLPVVADDDGRSTHLTRSDELGVHTWLSAFMAKDNKLHFVYWAETTPQRQRYLRYDPQTGKKEVDIERIFSKRAMSEPNDSGVFVANRTKPGSPLYYVSTIDDRKRLACLVSTNNGRSWREYAISDRKFKNRVYSISAARDVTHDGWIVGTFTDVADGAKTYFEPNSGKVYFFRIKAR